ncbi:hypothetical protein F5Y11DRAFT_336951 [Daldinia sp. FL1419]|nr:hypothetical protein F5Y11DRAFT_336951 [Daldinia sp. FL1419]
MEIGLDELIESLLTEIAFSGARGCSVSTLLEAIEAFYSHAQEQIGGFAAGRHGKGQKSGNANDGVPRSGDASSTHQKARSYDLSMCSKVWGWLVSRADVSVGTNRQFNHLKLEEILALAEEEDDPPSEGDIGKSKKKTSTSANERQRSSKSHRGPEGAPPKYRPRLHVSDERQWKTIAGHGPDLKRLPLFEWKALVDIASVREEGILQGDLVRLSGQDKRSLPTRTDALAKKGYIIKQPIILRGCRSSKLWLARFAERAKENRDGLNLEKLDLSKETLTKDLRPVPFSTSWNGERLDYIAIAQAFNAVIKAWGIMRYCDVRTKLDANRVPQMRALAKTSRWFTSIGAVTFVAARFANGQRLFKDCVKFIREPTAEEWRVFRTTPSAHIKVPSARLGKRGQASRARYNKGTNFSPHSQAKPKQASNNEHQAKSSEKEQLVPSLWSPYKPMVNTAFDIIKRAGPKGSSNLEIGRQTLGYSYRKYIAALTGALSLPNSQPPHLQHLNITSQLNRIGKTMTYQFFADGEVCNPPGEQGNGNKDNSQDANINGQILDEHGSQPNLTAPRSTYTYSQPQPSKMSSTPISLFQLHNELLVPKPKKGRKRKRGPHDEQTNDIRSDPRGHPGKMPRVGNGLSRDINADEGSKGMTNDSQEAHKNEHESISVPVVTPQKSISNRDSPAPLASSLPASLPRPSGVYREPDNMLDPPGKKGRRKKSLVLTLKCPSLKPWLESLYNNQPRNSSESFLCQPGPQPTNPTQDLSQDTLGGNSTLLAGPEANQTKQKPNKRGGKTIFRCDKCGNSWKNSNGLDYHLNKSRTDCNPTYVPGPPPPPKQLAVPKLISKTVLPKRTHSQEPDQGPDTLQLPDLARKSSHRNSDVGSSRPLLPSKRIRPSQNFAPDDDIVSSDTRGYVRSSIILQNVEAYDVIDHRKRRENSQMTVTNPSSTISLTHQTNQISPQVTSREQLQNVKPDPKRRAEIRKGHVGTATQEGSRKRKSNTAPPRGQSHESRVRKSESNIMVPQPHSEQREANNRASAQFDFNLRPTPLRSTTPISGTTASSVALGYSNKTNNNQESGAAAGQSNHEATLPSQSTPKKPRKSSTLTVGTIRRDRTNRIVQHLLDKNDGVFPGQRSLYLAMVSIWAKEYSDIEPPDWKVCQNVVNQMEKASVLTQHRFFFLDDNGKLQECCVLARNQQELSSITDLAADPKVVMVKEKMREMHPEPYIPEGFSLSQDESEIFDALASKYRDSASSDGPRKPFRKSNVTEDIEVLQYPAYVVNGAPTHAVSSKRPAEEGELSDAAPAKKVRVDAGDIGKPRKTPKPRKKGEQREYWATAKVAKYLWNQKQNPGEKWNQKHANLQDYDTGAWSVLPQEATLMRSSIDRILSSLRTSRESALVSMRRSSSSRSDSTEGSPGGNTADSPGGLLWEHSVTGGDREENFDVLIPSIEERATKDPTDRFVNPTISTSFIPEDSGSEDEEEDDTTLIGTHHEDVADENSTPPSEEADAIFARSKTIRNTRPGCWPWLPVSFFESNSASFTLAGAMPEARWFQRENLPQNSGDIIKSLRGKFQFNSWADPYYGKFLREVGIIERWEQSAEGSQILLHGSVAPDYIFISLSSEESRANMKPITPEWPSKGQYTVDNIPEEIKNASLDDENAGLSIIHRNRGRPKREHPIGHSRDQAKPSAKKPMKKVHALPISHVDIQYKTRPLRPIPVQHRGRVSIPRPNEDGLGLSGETEVIAAFVVFKTLLGGVDRKPDIGSILKAFPKFSHSALRKFWPRVNRERKTYIDALTEKFQSAFLEAYEAGKIAPLDYDDIDSYDWQTLIIWATKLETHDKVKLPRSRRDLEETYSLEDVGNEATDWRETWFQNLASIYSRVEATASEPISIPSGHDVLDEEVIGRARSWVRSLCVTPIRGAKMPEEIRERLLSLSGGDEAETNKLLKKVVDKLISERVASRSKGKILGQSLRLHGVFAKHLEKSATVEKFAQSAKFKTLLDESFRKGQDFRVPYVADDGTIMAIFNLQAKGHIHAQAMDIPNIPFGFEPGNYDGRTFPKSYYHFNVKLSPTETYVFNEDLPVLQQAVHIKVPQQGPRDEIPIWVDFFGNLDKARWITYLSMTTLALATKGPLTPQTASVLLKPFVEPFEAKLIMDWIDGLGILERHDSGQSATVGEWWWLVVGRLALDALGRSSSRS